MWCCWSSMLQPSACPGSACVASYALEGGEGIVIVVNKIDLSQAALPQAPYWQKELLKDFQVRAFCSHRRGLSQDEGGSGGADADCP